MSLNRPKSSCLFAAEDLRCNDRQWAAYESRGHCVVLAGPGSGKTKILTTKMARMLAEDIHFPRGIACITYSNQCGNELKTRLKKLGIEESSRIFIGTVHSFCLLEVIFPYARLAGIQLSNPIRVATPSEQARYFSAAVKAVIGDENPSHIRTNFDKFRRTILDKRSSEWLNDDRYRPLITTYEQSLSDAGIIDFDGMTLTGLSLIENNMWIRKALQAKYPILVVDEYQDLGIPLHRIVTHLCFNGGMRLFAVGDPDQSIYGFTGAKPSLMTELAERPNVETVHLRLNYRCGKTIVSASTTALAEERDFLSAGEHAGVVQDYQCPEGFEEQISLAVKTIIPDALQRRKGRTLGDIGVLYQNQHDGGSIAQAVENAGIEYVRFDQGNPYPRTPLLSWLEDCARWCSVGWRYGEPKLSVLLQRWMRFNSFVAKDSDKMKCHRNLVKFLFDFRTPDMPLIDWLEMFSKQGLYAWFKNNPIMADEVEAIKSLYEACKSGKPLEKYTLACFGSQRGSSDRLNLTTIHSSKGLEYDVVIMLGLEQGRIPYYNASESQEKESRRLFYVAMTRARYEVHLLWSGWYCIKGKRYSNGRSKFVSEVIEKLAGV